MPDILSPAEIDGLLDNPGSHYHVIRNPIYLSEMRFGEHDVPFRSTKKRPNWWFRIWYRVLLGWTWHELKEKE